ncbi:helix-turn-helix domain containing protein [Peptococcaceae bacterium]|nr:helix-turn-helix domain containing protein [Peptococcaceae bacterium]
MEFEFQEKVAAFRYSLIAPIVSRQTPMAPGEIKACLEDTASKVYEIPGSHKGNLSVRTLERYLSKYRHAGWDGLKPQPRQNQGNTLPYGWVPEDRGCGIANSD